MQQRSVGLYFAPVRWFWGCDELVKEYGLDELDRRIILGYLRLSESDRVEVRRYVQGLLDVVTGAGKLQAEDIDKNTDSDGGYS